MRRAGLGLWPWYPTTLIERAAIWVGPVAVLMTAAIAPTRVSALVLAGAALILHVGAIVALRPAPAEHFARLRRRIQRRTVLEAVWWLEGISGESHLDTYEALQEAGFIAAVAGRRSASDEFRLGEQVWRFPHVSQTGWTLERLTAKGWSFVLASDTTHGGS